MKTNQNACNARLALNLGIIICNGVLMILLQDHWAIIFPSLGMFGGLLLTAIAFRETVNNSTNHNN